MRLTPLKAFLLFVVGVALFYSLERFITRHKKAKTDKQKRVELANGRRTKILQYFDSVSTVKTDRVGPRHLKAFTSCQDIGRELGSPTQIEEKETSFTLIYSLETETDVDVYKFGCSKIGDRWFLYRVELAGESTIYMVDSISFKDKGL